MTAIDLARTPSEPTESPDAQAAADPGCEELASEAIAMGLRKIEILAWRDLDDPEAGGSELHSHRIASRWAEAGLEVNFRTSAVPNQPAAIRRSGYEAVRRNGRYGVFAAAAYEGVRSSRTPDALVEVWNGMPFFSPLWFRGPRIVFLHHVHAEMWRMVLPGWLAAAGRCVESVLAPRLYRRSEIVTLSQSSKDEIVTLLKLPGSRVTVVPPGVDPRFTPGGKRSAAPLVVAVGRLVPVKRFDLLMHALALVKREHPTLKAVIIGEGYERDRLEALRRQLHADSWITLPGRVDEAEVRSWYRRAWVVASTSLREGWGMTLTEAGACRTPGVATRIAGHRDAVLDGETGLLADGERGVAGALTRILSDEALRRRLGRAAEERARAFTWDATARSTLATLVDKAKKHTGTRARTS